MLSGTIETARLTLRPVSRADAVELHVLMTWNIARWLSRVPWPLPPEQVTRYVAAAELDSRRGSTAHHTILVDGEPAGMIGLTRQDGAMSLGYWLAEKHWGKGLMSEAAAAYVDRFFEETRAVHLVSGVFVGNHASLRIQEKLGFVVVGESLRPCQALGGRKPHYDTVLGRARWSGRLAA